VPGVKTGYGEHVRIQPRRTTEVIAGSDTSGCIVPDITECVNLARRGRNFADRVVARPPSTIRAVTPRNLVKRYVEKTMQTGLPQRICAPLGESRPVAPSAAKVTILSLSSLSTYSHRPLGASAK
jgi:hypothetical protein